MRKSAISLSLILMSTLIMLVPFTSINFPNVKAQEYDKYGDSFYSQYPTDDKKYECRTGPFEGFFVSSAEFCKHVKFDDRKDNSRDNNNTRAQGPPGPAGPQGLTGPPGPPGPTGAIGATGPAGVPGLQGERGLTGATGMQGPAGEDGMDGAQGLRGFNGTNGEQGPQGINVLNDINTYVRSADLVQQQGATQVFSSLTVSCDAEDAVLSGGYILNDLNFRPFSVVGNNINPAVNGWIVQLTALTGTDLSGFVSVKCFDNPPLQP